MAESEEDLRRYLREKVAEEGRAVALTRSPRGQRRLLTLDPIAPDMKFGTTIEAPVGPSDPAPAAQPQSQASSPPATPPPAPPVAAAQSPAMPPPMPAVVAGPIPAGGNAIARDVLRAIAVFGGVIAVGAGVILGQRSAEDTTVWLIVAVALAACVVLFVAAGRLLGADQHDPGNPPIVR